MDKEQSNTLKLIAMVTMLIDHIGAGIYGASIIRIPSLPMRIIGRISFPLFAYQAAVSMDKTKDPVKYMGRLLLFALISHIPFSAFTGGGYNIFFTLLYGTFTIYLYQRVNLYTALLFGMTSFFFPTMDYSAYGVFMIFSFYYFRNSKEKSILSFCALTLLYSYYNWQYQALALLAIPIIFFISLPKTKINKYVFYIFYPLHFWIAYIFITYFYSV